LQGFYGEVYKGKYQGKLVAIKCIKNSKDFSTGDFEKEFRVMVQMNHKNIISMIGKCHGESMNVPLLPVKKIIIFFVCAGDQPWLVMEYADCGSLDHYIRLNKDSLTSLDLLQFARGIAEVFCLMQ
jgi:serine/threonine protein kinase